MANWIVEFKSIAGSLYKVQIAGASGDTDIQLLPSDHPFYIEEEGKEDLFVPVKTQSGYVEIITDDFSLLKQILPAKGGIRSVWLGAYSEYTQEYITIFKGWVQPKILSFKMWRGKQTLRIPIECELSALRYHRENIFNSNIISVHRLIGSLLNTNHPIPFDTVIMQGGMLVESPIGDSDGMEKAWLRKKVYTSAFFNGDHSHLEILEYICTFFGWTARTMGNSVSFLANRNIDSGYVLGSIDLQSLREGNLAMFRFRWRSKNLNNDAICSDSITARYIEGVGNAKVTCPIDSFDSDISFPSDEIKTAIDQGEIAANTEYQTTWTPGTTGFNYRLKFTRTAPTSFPFSISQEWSLIEMENVHPSLDKKDSHDVADWEYTLNIWMSERASMDLATSGAWIRTVGEYFRGILGFQSNNSVSFNVEGILSILPQGKRYRWYNQTESVEAFTEMPDFKFGIKVQIGNLWYNAISGQWSQIVNESDKWITTTIEEGVKLSIPAGGMSGVLRFYINAEQENGRTFGTFLTEGCVSLTGCSIEFSATEQEDINSNITDVVFSTRNDSFSKNVNYNTVLAVNETYMRKSRNVLLNPDESPCDGLYLYQDSNEIYNPLQYLTDNVIKETSLQHTYIEIPARKDLLQIDFDEMMTSTILVPSAGNNERYYMSAFSFDARTEELKLKLIQREN